MRFFNTAGVCFPDRHYMLPPEPRLPDARRLIGQGHYFVVHAPRQTGKTTTLRALAHTLTAEGRYAAVYATCEVGRAAGEDYGAAQRGILSNLRSHAESGLPPELWPPPWPDAPDDDLLRSSIAAWARVCPRQLVLFLDEIDALAGPSLFSVLSQLRAGSVERPTGFAHSVAVCGMRDVRDYKTASGGDPSRMGGASPFNIKTESLLIGNFTEAEVACLYGHHTEETGQEFTAEALSRAFAYTEGQPWLVNALAREVIEKMGVDPPTAITAEHVDEAKERLILARATHLDSLAAKLSEPRVRRVIEPIIAGDLIQLDPYDDDLSYLRDLGLIALGRTARIANPIYREVIVRVLGTGVEANITEDPRTFVLPDGRLDFDRLLREFIGFWRQHGEILTSGEHYHEVAPQLVLMAYLHRMANGGAASEVERSGAERSSGANGPHSGYIDREYGVGRGRIDLVVRWPYRDPQGKRRWQYEPVELKLWRRGRPDPTPEGLRQLDEYLDRIGADHGTLVVFDRRDPESAPHERTELTSAGTASGRPVVLVRA